MNFFLQRKANDKKNLETLASHNAHRFNQNIKDEEEKENNKFYFNMNEMKIESNVPDKSLITKNSDCKDF